MEINSSNCCSSKVGINGMAEMLKSHQGQETGNTKGRNPSSDADISSLGMMTQRPSIISEEGQAEMQSFKKQIMQSSRAGEFNAEALAEQAPDELKAYADEMGVELTSMLTQLNEKMEQFQGMGGMQGKEMQAGMNPPNGTEQEDRIKTLMDTLFGEGNSET